MRKGCRMLMAVLGGVTLLSGCGTAADIAEDAGFDELIPAERENEASAESTEEPQDSEQADDASEEDARELSELDIVVDNSPPEPKQSGDATENPRLYPVEVDGRWGYMDENGAIAIEPEYDVTFPFSDGWGRAKRDDTFFFLDPDGEVQLSSDLEFVDDFSEGLAVAREVERTDENVRDGIFGYINREGEWVMPPQFKQAYPFSEGLAHVDVNVGDDPAFGPTGAAVFAYITPDGSAGIDRLFDGAQRFSDGLAAVEDNFLWGYIDREGEFLIDPDYHVATPFSDGRAAVSSSSMSEDWFHIDESGEPITDRTWEVARPFSEGLAAVAEYDRGSRETTWHYIDREGEIVFGGYLFAESWYQGLGRVVFRGDQPGGYLARGSEPSFGGGFWDDRVEFYPDYEWVWIDETGEPVRDPEGSA